MIHRSVSLTILLTICAIASFAQNNTFPTSGNVGIGTTSPQLKLDVQEGGLSIGGRNPITSVNGFSNALQLTGFSTAAIVFRPGDASELMFGFHNDGIFYWGSKTNGYGMWLNKTGILKVYNSIRVGSSPLPGYQLSVDGKIAAKEVNVTLNGWADYVFLPDYRLRPIAELEDFVKMHGHLPGIPPASEVEAKGIDLGEMNKLLLEKVEELTLYLIDLRKELDAMKEKLQNTD